MQNNIKRIILVFIIGLFIFDVESVYAGECDNNNYACSSCTYYSEDYKDSITYTVKSDGKEIKVTRDKDSLYRKSSNIMQMSQTYKIEADYIAAETFVYKEGDNKKLKCLDNIYVNPRNMSNYIEMHPNNPQGSYKSLSITSQENNGKYVYGENQKTLSCTFKTYTQLPMGYNTTGDSTIVSDGKSLLSINFSESKLKLDKDISNYNSYASLFNVNNKKCPESLYIVCTAAGVCNISTEGISGTDTSGKETNEKYTDTNTNESKKINCTYTGMLNGGSIKITNPTGGSYDYVITYPDGRVVKTSLLSGVAGTGINKYNSLPTSKCEDIFYSKNKDVIKAVDADNTYVDNAVKTVCHSYTDAEQFCANGKCKISNAICGNSGDSEYGSCPSQLRPAIVFIKRAVFNTLKIFIPILLILLGTIDMARAVMANDDKGLKDATARLIRRFIIAILFFFITTIVSLIITRIAKTTDVEDSDDWKACWIDIN